MDGSWAPPGCRRSGCCPPRPSRCRRSRARRCSSRSAPRAAPSSPSRSSTRSNVTWIDRPGPSGVQSMAFLVDNRLSAAPRTINCNRPSRMRAPGGLRESSMTPAPAGFSSPGAVSLQLASTFASGASKSSSKWTRPFGRSRAGSLLSMRTSSTTKLRPSAAKRANPPSGRSSAFSTSDFPSMDQSTRCSRRNWPPPMLVIRTP